MIHISATDNYPLSAQLYDPEQEVANQKILIINSATAIDKKLYHHYAIFMAENGYQVITYDYRGIAGSRPKKLRNFSASFIDWGQKDFEGVVNYTKKNFPNHKIITLGHSIGGSIIGMTEKNKEISGIINVGAQIAYYKDWKKDQRTKIYFMWHIVFPAVTKVFGYFPGKKLGLLEDIPKGVVQQWHNQRKHDDMKHQMKLNGTNFFYDSYPNKLLTLGVSDDPIGTLPAIQRIHNLFEKSDKNLEMIQVSKLDTKEIGHFGFFSRKFKHTLWQKTLNWFDQI